MPLRCSCMCVTYEKRKEREKNRSIKDAAKKPINVKNRLFAWPRRKRKKYLQKPVPRMSIRKKKRFKEFPIRSPNNSFLNQISLYYSYLKLNIHQTCHAIREIKRRRKKASDIFLYREKLQRFFLYLEGLLVGMPCTHKVCRVHGRIKRRVFYIKRREKSKKKKNTSAQRGRGRKTRTGTTAIRLWIPERH